MPEASGPAAPEPDYAVRRRRWRTFLFVFALTCGAICLDLITTYLGFQRVGPRFEQNAIALFLIQKVGWIGVSGILVIVCFVCFRSFKLVYWRFGVRWSLVLNLLIAVVCTFRWLVVITDTAWLIRK